LELPEELKPQIKGMVISSSSRLTRLIYAVDIDILRPWSCVMQEYIVVKIVANPQKKFYTK
jgi:hypothetical protein